MNSAIERLEKYEVYSPDNEPFMETHGGICAIL